MTIKLTAIVLGLSLVACSKKKDAPKEEGSAAPTTEPAPKTEPTPKTEPAPTAKSTEPPPAAKTEPTPAPAAGGVKCGDAGVLGGGAIPFCIKVPDGYKAGKVEKPDNWSSVDFKKDGALEIYTKWTDGTNGYDGLVDILKSESTDASVKLIASGDTAGGSGKFAQWDTSPNAKAGADHQIKIEAIIKGPKGIIKCSTSWWSPREKTGQDAADACKSITPQ